MKNQPRGAFTLVELLVVMVIVGILIVLTFPNFTALRNKAEGVVCMGRLRGLWTAFSSNLNDGNPWPQLPTNITVGTQGEQQWWLDYSATNLNLTSNDWQCPTVVRNQKSLTNNQQISLISYLPTLFDSKPLSPKNWPRMPWFTEIQGGHGSGVLSVRADGSVCPVQDP
jgi:prepilin-type N-terminal cleavage/methylation domain-containing protein